MHTLWSFQVVHWVQVSNATAHRHAFAKHDTTQRRPCTESVWRRVNQLRSCKSFPICCSKSFSKCASTSMLLFHFLLLLTHRNCWHKQNYLPHQNDLIKNMLIQLFTHWQIIWMRCCTRRMYTNLCTIFVLGHSTGSSHVDWPRLCAGGKWVRLQTKIRHGLTGRK